MKIKAANSIDFKACILMACRIHNTSMTQESLKLNRNKFWMRNICERNNPNLATIEECAKAFGLTAPQLLTICE